MDEREKVAYLKERAKLLRKTALTMIYEAQSGHPGKALGARKDIPRRENRGRRPDGL